jgi:hypothetical protein
MNILKVIYKNVLDKLKSTFIEDIDFGLTQYTIYKKTLSKFYKKISELVSNPKEVPLILI